MAWFVSVGYGDGGVELFILRRCLPMFVIPFAHLFAPPL